MEGLRLRTAATGTRDLPCSRCQATGCPWDWLAAHVLCPDCQEALVSGEGEPLIEPVEPRRCAVCPHVGVVRYGTLPLHGSRVLELDLCPHHLRALLRRRLDAVTLRQFGRLLQTLGVAWRQVFLLHEEFYDDQGRALRPVPDPA
jgi:hypothetical protein